MTKNMVMNKQWNKTAEGRYTFSVNDHVVGAINIAHNTTNRRAVANLGGNTYTIWQTGFWKNGLEKTAIFADEYNF